MKESKPLKGKSERREDILAAAVRVFARLSVAACTMDDVAREAQVSKGGLYRHFPSKDELFFTVAIQETRAFENRLRDVVTQHEDAPGFSVARACIAELVRFAKEESERFSVAVRGVGMQCPSEATSTLFAEYQNSIVALLDVASSALARGQQDGTVRVDIPADRLAFNVWGALLGVLQLEEHEAQFKRRVVDLPPSGNLADEFVDFFVAGLRPNAVP
jgi:AcrR family transcriptional regulator